MNAILDETDRRLVLATQEGLPLERRPYDVLGDRLGISGDEVLIVGQDVAAAGAGLIDLLLSSGGELVTVLTGHGVDDSVGAALQDHVHNQHLGAELVTYHTGHRGDALLIGVE